MSSVLDPATIASLRTLSQQLATPDTYEVVRETSAPDGAGGTTATESVIESGGCLLVAGARLPDERMMAERLAFGQPYSVRMLPVTTVLTPADVVRVNGRRLQVGGVIKPGAWAMSSTAICEERG